MLEPIAGETCGFIGLGSQGAPMARRMIDAGLQVILWARRPASLAPFRQTRAQFASELTDLAARAHHIGVCVVNDADVQEVCGRLIPAMHAGARIAIHSTVHPKTCLGIAAQAVRHGVEIIDAPVSGGAPAAESGTLTIMAGGDPHTFAAARPIFATFGRVIVHLGALGSGQAAKLINNTLMAANLAMAYHALQAGEKLGLDRAALVQMLGAGSGRSFALEVCSRMSSPSDFAHGASLLAKDLNLLGELMEAHSPLFDPLHGAASPFLELALSEQRPPGRNWRSEA